MESFDIWVCSYQLYDNKTYGYHESSINSTRSATIWSENNEQTWQWQLQDLYTNYSFSRFDISSYDEARQDLFDYLRRQ